MRKGLTHWSGGLAAVAACAALLVSSLVAQPRPEDIFISADTDAFDPGLPVGAEFPSIRALYEGAEITEIDRFIRDKGAIFIANRSVDW